MFTLPIRLFDEVTQYIVFTLDRISTSIKVRRWIGRDEYYEIKRGN